MPREKAPAFQFYPKDFLSDERVLVMTHTERGIYITFLCVCWLEGSLPADVKGLARIAGMLPTRFEKLWQGPLCRCFQAREDGRLTHKRLDMEREKQSRFLRRQTDAAASRWHRSGIASAMPNACPRVEDEEEESLGSTDRIVHISTARSDSVEERAGRLREELYPAWFAKYRNGAKLRIPLIANSLEYQDALSVVQTWDDARIEKLARVFLTTDEEWIASTDRSFRLFASKATWCDDKLREWETKQGIA